MSQKKSEATQELSRAEWEDSPASLKQKSYCLALFRKTNLKLRMFQCDEELISKIMELENLDVRNLTKGEAHYWISLLKKKLAWQRC